MSDATEAWEAWYGNPDVASDTPSIAFAAGFTAGQVAVTDMLKQFLPEWNYPDYVIAAICLEIKARLDDAGDGR